MTKSESARRALGALRAKRPNMHLKGAHLTAMRRRLKELKGVEDALMDLPLNTMSMGKFNTLIKTIRGVRTSLIVLAEDLVKETRR